MVVVDAMHRSWFPELIVDTDDPSKGDSDIGGVPEPVAMSKVLFVEMSAVASDVVAEVGALSTDFDRNDPLGAGVVLTESDPVSTREKVLGGMMRL